MKSTTQRRNVARLGTAVAAATLLVGATACSSDDDTPSEPAETEVDKELDEVDKELDEVEKEVDEELDG